MQFCSNNVSIKHTILYVKYVITNKVGRKKVTITPLSQQFRQKMLTYNYLTWSWKLKDRKFIKDLGMWSMKMAFNKQLFLSRRLPQTKEIE